MTTTATLSSALRSWSRTCKLLDVRLSAEFTRIRLQRSFNIPFTELDKWWSILPDKGVEFGVVLPDLWEGDSGWNDMKRFGEVKKGQRKLRCDEGAICLDESPHESTPRPLLLSQEHKQHQNHPLVTRLTSCGWNVTHIFIANEQLFNIATDLGLSETGEQGLNDLEVLFQPCDFLEECVTIIEDKLMQTDRSSSFVPNTQLPFTALDIGCGSGRDMAYLALRGWSNITGIDSWSAAVERAQAVAERLGVQDRVQVVEGEFVDGVFECQSRGAGQNHTALSNSRHNSRPTNEDGELRDKPPHKHSNHEILQRQYDLIMCVRFLHRPLLPQLTSLLKPGGYLLYSTFVTGVEKFGRPTSRDHILERDELTRVCKELEVIVDEERRLADGRPIVCYLGQKPCVVEEGES